MGNFGELQYMLVL